MLVSIIFYIATIITSVVLFVAALVAWLSEYVESRALAAFIVGLLFLLLSRLIYFLSARKAIENINERSRATGGTFIDTLVAGIEGEGKRSFLIKRAKPDGKSYASDIANKYGLSFDKINEKFAKKQTN